MALTFFWRCEGTTLDGTHDFSAGDTTAAAQNSATLDAAAARIGSSGILVNASGKHYRFDPASIASLSEGAIGFWFRVGGSQGTMVILRGSSETNHIRVDLTGLGARVLLSIGNAANGSVSLNTNLGTVNEDITTGAWYFVVVRYDISNDRRRVEVYDADMVLIQYHTDLTTDLSAYGPAAFDSSDGIRVGDIGGWTSSTNYLHIDNLFIADDYDEPLQDFADITSYTEYGVSASAPSKSLGLLLRGCG